MMSKFDFNDLSPRSEIVYVAGKRYEMREASEGVAIRYRNATLASFRLVDGKASRIEGLADAEASLVADCLKGESGDGQFTTLVTPDLVRSWPARVVKPLFEWIKDASDLGETEKDPDPELISLARKDLAREHHPDNGGNALTMMGVNIALDWVKRQAREREESRKNGQPAGSGTFEQPKELAGQSENT